MRPGPPTDGGQNPHNPRCLDVSDRHHLGAVDDAHVRGLGCLCHKPSEDRLGTLSQPDLYDGVVAQFRTTSCPGCIRYVRRPGYGIARREGDARPGPPVPEHPAEVQRGAYGQLFEGESAVIHRRLLHERRMTGAAFLVDGLLCEHGRSR